MSKTFPTIASSIGIHRLQNNNKMKNTKQSTTLTELSDSPAKFNKGADVTIPNHLRNGSENGILVDCNFNYIQRQYEYTVKTETGFFKRLESEIQLVDATPDWTSATPFIVGQTMITPSNFSMFIGYAKNGTPCFYFANVDADGDPVNIQDAIDDLTNYLNVDQKSFNEILTRVSMNYSTIHSVEKSIRRHYNFESLKIIHAMQNGERGHKLGNLYFTMLNSTK